MMKTALRSKEKAVYRVVNAGVLAGAVLLGGQGFLGTGEFGRAHLLTALAVLAVAGGLNFMRVRGRILCLAGLLVLLVTGASAAGMEDSIVIVKGYLPWLVGTGEAPEAWGWGYGLVQTGFLTGMCYVAQMLFEKLQTLKIVAGTLAFLAMAYCLIAGRELDHYGVAFHLVFCVIVWMEWIQGRWKKERSQGNSREAHTLWIMPFLALYLVLLAAMPAPEEPYDWQWARNIYGRLRESILLYTRNIKWGSREGFGMAFSGFSEDGGLRGEVRKESGQTMRIRVSRDAFGAFVGNVYLTGLTYDAFDGRGWRQDWQGDSGAAFLDTAETLCAVRSYSEEYQRDYLREVLLEIRYEDFNTEYVFAPLKTWGVEGIEAADYAWADGSLRWTEQKGYGTEYALHYFRMNAGQQEFDRFLEEAGSGGEGNADGENREAGADGERREARADGENREAGADGESREGKADGESREGKADGEDREARADRENREAGERWEEDEKQRETWEKVLREYKRKNGETVTWDDVLLYREGIYENYLGEVRVSSEVADYMEEMTRGAVTDVEKLRAMEKALRSFSYTLTPGDLPGWVEEEGDFLDYFLLESRRGYCTYFATAFVLLARAEGIPARYVQGYCVPVPESGEAYVDSSMAHAWPEAYLEGVGWIPFEPTPGYGEMRYSPWGLAQSRQEEPPSEQEAPPPSNHEPGGEPEGTGGAAEPEEAAEEVPEENDGEAFSDWWKLLGIGIPLFLAVCAVVLAADSVMSRYRYRRRKPAERFRMEVFRNLEILSWLGVKKEGWETLQELRERAERLPGLEGKEAAVGILRFMEDYEKAVYGGEEAGEDTLESAVQAGETLLRLLKREKKWAYFYCRAFLRYRTKIPGSAEDGSRGGR